MNESNIILYETDEGKINVDVILKDETIWLTQKSIAKLFNVNVPAINKHLNNIFEDKELDKNLTISKMEIVRKEGNRNVNRELDFYNLDAIIAVGYRVNSKKATKFRIWATKILKDYMIKGFVIDVEKMKDGPKFGKDYYDELLQTIKEIRLSERRQYQKITDVFESTSIDYNYHFKNTLKLDCILILSIIVLSCILYPLYRPNISIISIYILLHIYDFIITPFKNIKICYIEVEDSAFRMTFNTIIAYILRMIISCLSTPFCTIFGQVCSSTYELIYSNIRYYKTKKRIIN